MRWMIGVILCGVFVSKAFSQGGLSWEERVLLAYIDVTDTSRANTSARIELLNEAGDQLVGYAWRMAPQQESPNMHHAIYAPGFDATISNTQSAAGSLRSYLDFAKQLSVGSETSGRNFPTELIQKQNNIVWLVDYLDRRGDVEYNSLAIQSLLRNPNYLADVSQKKSILYGYSMGGLVSRHALLSLEERGQPHNVGAYVSLDVPHRGAFLPPSLEAYARTLDSMLQDGLAAHTVAGFIHADVKRVVKAYDSAAARQSLGIYIGKATPRYKSWPSGSKTGQWRNLEKYYKSLIADNDLARHPTFYKLREKLVDMGSYPSLPINIGVSFGRADGQRLMAPHSRAATIANFRVETTGGIKLLSAELNSIRGHKLCRVETTSFEQGRSCPNLGLYGQHLESVFVGPGSTVDSFSKLSQAVSPGAGVTAVNEIQTFFGLAGVTTIPHSGGLGIDFQINKVEDRLSFVPIVSAFDGKGWARDFPFNQSIDSLEIPFDIAIADASLANGEPGSHTVITENVLDQIASRLSMSNAYTNQKTRGGLVAAESVASPTSSYWSHTGKFNTLRYIIPKSIRELPVVSDAKVEKALSTNRDDRSVIAAVLSAL